MKDPVLSRRDMIKQLGVVGAGFALTRGGVLRGAPDDIVVNGQAVELAVASLSAATVRLTLRPIENGSPEPLPFTGALVTDDEGSVVTSGRDSSAFRHVKAGDFVVRFGGHPPTIDVETADGRPVQTLALSATDPSMTFLLPEGPLLGLGEGGPQFDRRDSVERMRNGQGGYQLATHGTRAPVQWLVGTDGWAMFIHQPYGAFDFTGTDGVFTPHDAKPQPLDVFVVRSDDPRTIMREYARITGTPELPALWSFGYLQSHRTLAGPDEVMGVARTFREKQLPCDGLIYLGTGFCPSGWNTDNGEFTWKKENFPDPKKMIAQLHDEHFKVVLHVVLEGHELTGTVNDPCTTSPPLPSGRTPDGHWPPDREVACYWPFHKPLMEEGVDGWWPDQGDGFDGPSRFNRHRMYFEGSQLYRPDERPFALHRNASPGVQRFGSFIWSGDVRSLWETLRTHVAVAINTSLSGLPYWGTDIGGFIPTDELTGELYVRWFQFGAFCPLFRSHGRNWHLRLPWGWDGGDGGPDETRGWKPAPEELHNKQVEPICKKYLELRYRLLPYLYTAAKDGQETGMPILRALWLHDPTDPVAVSRGDEYLWGDAMLVAPVVEHAARFRRVYLPRGSWYDFWTEEGVLGGRELERRVDLETTPLYVRAGAIIPMGPVKQYAEEPSDEPLELVVYPGSDGSGSLYEDDGHTFDYEKGAYMRVDMTWSDTTRRLSLRLRGGSRMLEPKERTFRVRVVGESATHEVHFDGSPVDLQL